MPSAELNERDGVIRINAKGQLYDSSTGRRIKAGSVSPEYEAWLRSQQDEQPNPLAEATENQIVDVAAPEPSKSAAPSGRVYPLRIWTGGPGMLQEKIYISGKPAGLRPAGNGAYYIKNEQEYQAIVAALGKRRIWLDDVIDEDEPWPKCDICGWLCASSKALLFHVNNAHGRPQA